MRRRVVADSDSMEPQPRQPLKNSEANIRSVEGCSCYKPEVSTPQNFFEKAWKAIEDGDLSKLEEAVQEMKASKSGSSALVDTCHLMEKSGVGYSVSLLALCGFHGRKDMVDLFLLEGAGMNTNSSCKLHGPGTPVLQMMVHCLIQNKCDQLSVTMLEYFIQKGAELSGNIATRHFGLAHNDTGGVKYGVLDLPLSMQRVDCAKVLVEKGVHVLTGGCPKGETFIVVPMFQEYRDHGTNEFIRWAFNEYLPQHPEIDLNHIIQSIINMKVRDEISRLWQSVRRSPAHAILTSHHEETIKRLVECAKNDFEGLDLLDERSCTGKTALHVAAENGDMESVNILLRLGADTEVSDNSDVSPFMLAVKKGHSEVVKAMMKEKPELVSSQLGSGSTVIHWALEECQCSAFFKCCFEEYPKALLTARDSQGNTIAHLVAASGNTEVFEILWSEEFTEAFFSDQNFEGKTPLQLAVDNGSFNVLKTFETRIYGERECTTPRWHHNLKNDWWHKIVPYVLYASACGSLSAVKYFIACGQEPNISDNGKTPLLCAAEAGHDEIVAYLLQFRTVRTDLEKEQGEVSSASVSPLLIAAQNGHAACVALLLQSGANVFQRDYKDRNCLMIAIQNHHKKTALAILSDKNGMKALKRDRNPTPLQLLIKEMPDLAEYVLNKCITQDQQQICIRNFLCSKPTVTANQPVNYNFDHLVEDNHILDWMVEHDRLELLQHPLVDNFLSQKFWLMAFPLFLLNVLFYCALLLALNLFVLVVPRPGPDSETCPESNVVNGNSSKCHDQNGSDWSCLDILAILLYDLSSLGLLMAAMQFIKSGWRFFKDSDNYFQLALYVSTIIFIRGFDNECWCSNTWQWQIGALAVFLSWVNFIFILRYLSFTAVPINMFFGICVTFLKLIFVPVVLILAFGVPNYMVFVRTASSSEQVGNLTAFRSPGHAIAKTLLQLVGEFDFEATFNQGALLYNPTAYILFITFLITMPLLFTNLLTGLAVGDTQKQREKAEITKLKVWVEFILERERSRGITQTQCKTVYHLKKDESKDGSGNDFVVTLFGKEFSPANCFMNFFLKRFEKDYTYHAELAKELQQRNDEICRIVRAHNPVDDVREGIKEGFSNLKHEMMILDTVKEGMTELNEDIKQETVTPQLVDTVREDIAELKNDVSSLKEEMMALDVREDMSKLKEDISTLKQEMTSLLQALESKIEAIAGFNH